MKGAAPRHRRYGPRADDGSAQPNPVCRLDRRGRARGADQRFHGLQHLAFRAAAAAALIIGVFAVIGLVSGCLLMVREARLALEHLAEEAAMPGTPTSGRRPPSSRPGSSAF